MVDPNRTPPASVFLKSGRLGIIPMGAPGPMPPPGILEAAIGNVPGPIGLVLAANSPFGTSAVGDCIREFSKSERNCIMNTTPMTAPMRPRAPIVDIAMITTDRIPRFFGVATGKFPRATFEPAAYPNGLDAPAGLRASNGEPVCSDPAHGSGRVSDTWPIPKGSASSGCKLGITG